MIWLSLLLLQAVAAPEVLERGAVVFAAPPAIVTGLPERPGVAPGSEAGGLTSIVSPRPFATVSRNRPCRAGRIVSRNQTFQQ